MREKMTATGEALSKNQASINNEVFEEGTPSNEIVKEAEVPSSHGNSEEKTDTDAYEFKENGDTGGNLTDEASLSDEDYLQAEHLTDEDFLKEEHLSEDHCAAEEYIPEDDSAAAEHLSGEDDNSGSREDYESDLYQLKADFPALANLESIEELESPSEYLRFRTLGLTPKEALLATGQRLPSPTPPRPTSPIAAKPGGQRIPSHYLKMAREIFVNLSDREIQALYKRVK